MIHFVFLIFRSQSVYEPVELPVSIEHAKVMKSEPLPRPTPKWDTPNNW